MVVGPLSLVRLGRRLRLLLLLLLFEQVGSGQLVFLLLTPLVGLLFDLLLSSPLVDLLRPLPSLLLELNLLLLLLQLVRLLAPPLLRPRLVLLLLDLRYLSLQVLNQFIGVNRV